MSSERLDQKGPSDHSDTSHPAVSALTLYQNACRKHQEGDISSAERLYQQAVQADPTIQTAWRNLGALLRQRGQTKEARYCTEQALRLDSTDGSLWGNYGNVLRDQGLLDDSCKAFHHGLRHAPNSKGLLKGRCRIEPSPQALHPEPKARLASGTKR